MAIGRSGYLAVDAVQALRKVDLWGPHLLTQMVRIGVGSIPVALFIAMFTGVVLALMADYTFTGAMPLYLVGTLVGKTMVLELGPVLTGLALSGRVPGPAVGLLLPATALLILLAAGLAFGLSVLNVYFRDLGQVVPVATMLWFWLTPIVYEPGILPDAVVPLLRLNPLVPILDLFRRAIGAETSPLSAIPLAWPGLLVVALTAAGGFAVFQALARDVPDEI